MKPAALPPVSATLLVLSPGEEVAKRIESHLRNAGHAIRAAWVTDLEDMEEAIRRSPPDLVLCQDGMPAASIVEGLKLSARLRPDLPVLLLATKPFTMADTVAALRIGVRGLVIAGDTLQLQHLEMICLRELRTYAHIVELGRTRQRLADYEARHEKLVAGTADAVLHVQEGIITHANAAFAKLTGHKGSPIEGSPLMDFIAPDGLTSAKVFLKAFTLGKVKTDDAVELQLRSESGALKVTARVTIGEANGDRLLELLIRAPAALTPAAAAVSPPAPTSRLDLQQLLNVAIKANVQMHRALILVMVDKFYEVEQRLGYSEAEAALVQLAERLQPRLGKHDAQFRFSTALVALIVSRPSASEFESLADAVRRDIETHVFKTSKYEAQMTATVLAYPLAPSDKPDDVIDAAVREVRKLSREGGNRVAVAGPSAKAAQAAADEARKIDQIKRAMAENRLKLAYQSIASLEGGDRHHFDVLARMLDESGNEVPAREFIPAAEKHGLIVTIDRWVVAKALTVLAKRAGATDSSSLFVRLSEQSVREGDTLYRWLAEQAQKRPLKKEELVFSIQESIVESHIQKAKALSQALRSLGAQVAMDYFGVGSNSEKMLEHLSPNYVRFHYSFTKDFNDPQLQARFAELMTAAKKRSIKTIVGQVEDANAMARLWQLGVHYIQGYHIQAPEAVLLATDVR